MGSAKRPAGVVQSQLAASLREIRTSRGMSSYALARELKAIGWPISPSGITRIETGERGTSVDDLVALSVVLGCSPNRLLLPAYAIGDLVSVVGDVKARDTDVWAWATGEKPLTVPGGVQAAGPELAVFKIQNQPHRYVSETAP